MQRIASLILAVLFAATMVSPASAAGRVTLRCKTDIFAHNAEHTGNGIFDVVIDFDTKTVRLDRDGALFALMDATFTPDIINGLKTRVQSGVKIYDQIKIDRVSGHISYMQTRSNSHTATWYLGADCSKMPKPKF